MFFHSWAAVWRVVVTSFAVYVIIVAMLRIVGQQALAKMSGYDMVVTVTLGAIVATVPLMKDVTVSEGVAALVTLTALQELTRWLQSRSFLVHHAVREPPKVVLWDGQLIEERLVESKVSADEVRAAIRRKGVATLDDVLAVVLENDGEWSVVLRPDHECDDSALFGLAIPGRDWPDLADGVRPTSRPPHKE